MTTRWPDVNKLIVSLDNLTRETERIEYPIVSIHNDLYWLPMALARSLQEARTSLSMIQAGIKAVEDQR